ncbi:hypothetical protein H131_05938 [Lysinibacillus sphaericus OT4b.31]|uniref:Uncharacterized protein n=1 Tax=Lysinibacillus sphaericus OT4b.31 TaxID=1285586 RepID=R7ZHB9_LYSSH|nr:hypothetical protein H131_05938 [Lysinibacillus sphaericus OT4b.31]
MIMIIIINLVVNNNQIIFLSSFSQSLPPPKFFLNQSANIRPTNGLQLLDILLGIFCHWASNQLASIQKL